MTQVGLYWRQLRFWSSRRPGLLLWITLLLWVTLAQRLIMGLPLRGTGLLDDLGMGLLLLGVGLALQSLPRLVRVPLSLLLGIAIVLAGGTVVVYHAYFHAYPNAETLLMLRLLGAARSSVGALLTPTRILLVILLPGSLALGAALRSRLAPPLRMRPAMLCMALGLAVIGGLGQSGERLGDLGAEAGHNALASMLRWGSSEVRALVSPVDLGPEIERLRAEVWNWPDPKRYAPAAAGRYPLLKLPVAGDSPASAPHASPPNIVFVLMESVRASEMSLGHGRPSITPNLDRLAREGISFEPFYATGNQTIRGEFATMCSALPHFRAAPSYFRFPFNHFSCLPQVLQGLGYETHWISAYTASYANKRLFLSGHGTKHIHDGDELNKRQGLLKPKLGWGASDEDMFAWAVELLDQAKAPFFSELMTLSCHHPFDHHYGIPPPRTPLMRGATRTYRNYLRGLHYTDYAIGKFLELAKTRPWFENTIFVFTADHGAWEYPAKLAAREAPAEKLETATRTPFILWGPALSKALARGPRQVLGGQLDVAPTVLELTGQQAPNAFMGVSLFDTSVPKARRFAVMVEASAVSIRQDDRYCYRADWDCFDDAEPRCGAGRTPRPSGHTCFEGGPDLLHAGSEGALGLSSPRRLLPPAEARALTQRAQRLASFSNFLYGSDRLAP